MLLVSVPGLVDLFYVHRKGRPRPEASGLKIGRKLSPLQTCLGKAVKASSAVEAVVETESLVGVFAFTNAAHRLGAAETLESVPLAADALTGGGFSLMDCAWRFWCLCFGRYF
jgi:hypothetical protein